MSENGGGPRLRGWGSARARRANCSVLRGKPTGLTPGESGRQDGVVPVQMCAARASSRAANTWPSQCRGVTVHRCRSRQPERQLFATLSSLDTGVPCI